jgi:hypothetical protein
LLEVLAIANLGVVPTAFDILPTHADKLVNGWLFNVDIFWGLLGGSHIKAFKADGELVLVALLIH